MTSEIAFVALALIGWLAALGLVLSRIKHRATGLDRRLFFVDLVLFSALTEILFDSFVHLTETDNSGWELLALLAAGATIAGVVALFFTRGDVR